MFMKLTIKVVAFFLGHPVYAVNPHNLTPRRVCVHVRVMGLCDKRWTVANLKKKMLIGVFNNMNDDDKKPWFMCVWI